jgi:hypothetical protein
MYQTCDFKVLPELSQKCLTSAWAGTNSNEWGGSSKSLKDIPKATALLLWYSVPLSEESYNSASQFNAMEKRDVHLLCIVAYLAENRGLSLNFSSVFSSVFTLMFASLSGYMYTILLNKWRLHNPTALRVHGMPKEESGCIWVVF